MVEEIKLFKNKVIININNLDEKIIDLINKVLNVINNSKIVLPREYCINISQEQDEIKFECDNKVFKANKKNYLNILISLIEKIIGKYYLSLHGSCCTKDNKMYIFLGPKESGKSSLVTYLIMNGYTYVSDDVAILDNNKCISLFNPIYLDRKNMLLSLIDENNFTIFDTGWIKKGLIPNHLFLDDYEKIVFIRLKYEKNANNKLLKIESSHEKFDIIIKNIKECNSYDNCVLNSKRIIINSDIYFLSFNNFAKAMDAIKNA